MHRKLRYEITEAEEGIPLKVFLKRQGFSTQNLIELKKRPESVLVKDRPVYMTYRLQRGDLVAIQIIEEETSPNIIPVELPLDIVYEDEDILVVNKPAGMPVHPSQNNHDNSLGNAVVWYYRQQGIPFIFRCINRLDRDTSGLTIIARHMVSAGKLSSMVARKGVQGITREYLAIVRGKPEPAEGAVDAPLGRKPGSIIERMVDYEHGERAVTHYRVVKELPEHSLVSLILETGRTHQIRIHMKHIGCPLIGDYLYNPDMEHISRQALHACRLAFPHPITGKPLEFTAPLPEDMERIIILP